MTNPPQVRPLAAPPLQCQPALLAQLMYVEPEHDGRLVVVERRGAPVTLPSGAQLRVWRIFVMGRALWVDGDDRSDLWAAEACLQPITHLTVPCAKKMVTAQAEREAAAIVAELGRWFADHPLDHALIEASMMGAAREAIARHHARPVLLPYTAA